MPKPFLRPGPAHPAARWAVVALLLVSRLAQAGQALEARDDSGRIVALAAPAARIVTLAPHASELVVAAGAGAALVGISSADDYPAAILGRPRVGGAGGLDLEAIVALKPDLVIAWSSGNSRSQIDALERAGLTVYESDPASLEAVGTSLVRIGRLSGHTQEGEDAAARFAAQMQDLAQRVKGQRQVSVFYEVWDNPLMTVGGPQLASQMIALCGGRNIFDDLGALAPTVSAEAVVARNPEVIVTDPDALSRTAQSWSKVGHLSASERHQIVAIDPALLTRAGPRLVEGARALCAVLARARRAGGP